MGEPSFTWLQVQLKLVLPAVQVPAEGADGSIQIV